MSIEDFNVLERESESEKKIIKWNPTKTTCNAFYIKYYNRTDDIKERKKFWKKIFKGCKDFGAIIGKEYSRIV